MNIVGIGNCQVSALTKAMRVLYPDSQAQFFASSAKVAPVSLEQAMAAAHAADVLLVQPVLNRHSPFALARLRRELPGKSFLVMPYIYCDGLFSLCLAPAVGGRSYGHVFGQEAIERELAEAPVEEVIRRFRAGQIDFHVRARFETSHAELARREKYAHIKASPLITALMPRFVMMKTHNHPSRLLMQKILERLAKRMGLPVPDKAQWAQTRKALFLPEPCTVVTPRDAEELGFTYAIRPGWEEKGERLIRMIAASLPETRAAA